MTLSVRPAVSQMRFLLFSRAVHPELFRIQAEATSDFSIGEQRYTLRFRLCESGHFTEFSNAETRSVIASEIVCDGERSLPEFGRLLAHPLRGHRHLDLPLAQNLRYRAAFQLERLAGDTFWLYHEELQRDTERATLGCRFPHRDGEDRAPVSLIQMNRTTDSVSVHSFHTFPTERAVVKTQLLLEFTEPKIKPASGHVDISDFSEES